MASEEVEIVLEAPDDEFISDNNDEYEEGEIVEPHEDKKDEKIEKERDQNISGISYVSTTLKHNCLYNIYIGPTTGYHSATEWSNPYERTYYQNPKDRLYDYEQYLRNRTDFYSKILSLKNKRLACWLLLLLLLHQIEHFFFLFKNCLNKYVFQIFFRCLKITDCHASVLKKLCEEVLRKKVLKEDVFKKTSDYNCKEFNYSNNFENKHFNNNNGNNRKMYKRQNNRNNFPYIGHKFRRY